MDKATFELGREIRSSVLGKEFVDAAFKAADDFNMPMQELVTEYCWGAVWGRPGLDKKQRSMLNLAMISCLNRPHELRLHIAGALKNGVTRDEIREIFMQVAIYAGVPAGVDSFRAAKEVFEKIERRRRPGPWPSALALCRRASATPAGDRSMKSTIRITAVAAAAFIAGTFATTVTQGQATSGTRRAGAPRTSAAPPTGSRRPRCSTRKR